jgi:hypothetical protein
LFGNGHPNRFVGSFFTEAVAEQELGYVSSVNISGFGGTAGVKEPAFEISKVATTEDSTSCPDDYIICAA